LKRDGLQSVKRVSSNQLDHRVASLLQENRRSGRLEERIYPAISGRPSGAGSEMREHFVRAPASLLLSSTGESPHLEFETIFLSGRHADARRARNLHAVSTPFKLTMNRTLPLPLLLAAFQLGILAAVRAAAPVELPLVPVSNPPPIQMLVPGSRCASCPCILRNLNNLVYAPDGRLLPSATTATCTS